MDKSGAPCYVIRGHWDGQFTLAKVMAGEGKNLQTATPDVLWTADPVE